jgi:pilus assembly protein CpaF
MEGEMITLQNLFEFELERIEADRTVVGNLRPTGLRPSFLHKFRRHGIVAGPAIFGTPTDRKVSIGADPTVPISRGGGYR